MINSPVDEIKSRLDIIDVIQGYIRLQKAGRNYRANCPFHSEKTPSFMVSPERQIWRCFGCGKGGDIFAFVQEIEGVEFGDALRILAQRAGVELKKIDPQLKTERKELYEICDLASRFFAKQLESQTGKNIQNYLKLRGLKPEAIKQWKIGYAPNQWQALWDFLGSKGYSDQQIARAGLIVKAEREKKYYDRFRDRIIFPIFDLNGQIVGFTGRENPNNPDKRMGKYINIPNTLIYDKSRLLYGLDKAKLDIRKNDLCILMEGQMDVIMSHQTGLTNAVATSGTALTDYQLKIIKRYTENLALAFDMDLAGEAATKKGIDLSIQLGLNTKVVSLPDKKDPAECIQNNPTLWTKAVADSQHLFEYYLANTFSKYNPKTVEGKKEISKILLPLIKKIPNKVEQAHWLQETAKRLGVQENILTEEMKRYRIEKKEFVEEAVKNNLKCSLEEHILGIILTSNCSEFTGYSSHLFSDADLREMFKYLKRKKKLPTSLISRADEISFKAEAEKCLFGSEFQPEKELTFCFDQLKNRYDKDKRNHVTQEIQEAERKGDKEKIKILTQKFNNLLKN